MSYDIQDRKENHLSICLDEKSRIEKHLDYFDQIKLPHSALPEMSFHDISFKRELFSYSLNSPIFISSMTGGSEMGLQINQDLARVAQQQKMCLGLGSFRVLFRYPERANEFQLKHLAPDVPILGNLGAVQLKSLSHTQIIEWVKRLEFDALFLHLNPGQELFQKNGDDDFRDLLPNIEKFCELAPFPVIVKETGFGISPCDAQKLSNCGVYAIDVAGAGGTNWLMVESELSGDILGREFEDWGYATAVLLHCYQQLQQEVKTFPRHYWASGGIRSGSDVFKSLVLGADFVGIARPLIQAWNINQDHESVNLCLDDFHLQLKRLFLLCGVRSVEEAKQLPRFLGEKLKEESTYWQQMYKEWSENRS